MMFKNIFKKNKEDGFIYCPFCGSGYNYSNISFVYIIINKENEKICKCSDCNNIFMVERRIGKKPIYCIYYETYKIIKME